MPATVPPTLLEADEDAIAAALALADVPALLPALAYVTGDRSLLRDDLRPDQALMLTPDAGMLPAQNVAARQLALETILAWREQGCPLADPPDADGLRELLEFTVGVTGLEEYTQLFREELGLAGADLRRPDWRADDLAPDRDLTVAIVGAGMSGLLAAHRADQAGLDWVIIEKNDDVGGTWLENTYPGCRVDVPNHFYSYSFAQRDDWPQHFSTQEVLLDYFRSCADRFGLRDGIRFGTEVRRASWDDERNLWALDLETPDGPSTLEAHVLVSAVGQLNRPKMPDLDGVGDFEGPAFHSARWDHDVDIAGRRVGVVGTGASAMQVVPAIAGTAADVTVFQRTPAWLVPTPNYHDECEAGLNWLCTNIPTYTQWYRFWQFWRNSEGMLPLVTVDPAWEPKDEAVSGMNEMLRQLLVAYLTEQFGEDPGLLEAVTPHYAPGSKRVIRDNGVWAATLKRDDVHLVTDGIDRITPTGVRTVDGTDHELDVLVYGTGFQASKFLTPMEVRGRGGVDLHERWSGDARAHLGVTVPGFPNLFLLYGPNTNIVINGSIIFFSECEVDYLLASIRMLLEEGHAAMDCREEAHAAYNRRIDEGNLAMAWGVATVNSWYRNELGRSAQNWPFSLLEYWKQTRRPDPAEYELLG